MEKKSWEKTNWEWIVERRIAWIGLTYTHSRGEYGRIKVLDLTNPVFPRACKPNIIVIRAFMQTMPLWCGHYAPMNIQWWTHWSCQFGIHIIIIIAHHVLIMAVPFIRSAPNDCQTQAIGVHNHWLYYYTSFTLLYTVLCTYGMSLVISKGQLLFGLNVSISGTQYWVTDETHEKIIVRIFEIWNSKSDNSERIFRFFDGDACTKWIYTSTKWIEPGA